MSDNPILAFKAGRAFRTEGSNTVTPNPTKGAIILYKEDGLLHFTWKNRATNEVDEDLVMFPSDATFEKVSQAAGRVYVLKFSSSNQRHFFWMQDASYARDHDFVHNVNALLEDPEAVPTTSSPGASTSQTPAAAPQASSSNAAPGPAVVPAGHQQATPEQLEQLRNLVASMGGNASAQPDLSLTDILTPATLTPLFNSHPDLIPALFPHLPPDLPVPPSADALQRIISSPQFRAAVRSFDQALRTGLLGNLVTGLGLPQEAGTGVEAFLRAVQEQADREGGVGGESSNSGGGDRMDTD